MAYDRIHLPEADCSIFTLSSSVGRLSHFVAINSTFRKSSMKVRNLAYVHHIILSASSGHRQCITSASSVYHQRIISVSSGPHQDTITALSGHHQHIISALSAHHQCIISASLLHHQCIISASSVHHPCIIMAPSAHHQCIISALSAHHHGIFMASGTTFIPRVLNCLLCLVLKYASCYLKILNSCNATKVTSVMM